MIKPLILPDFDYEDIQYGFFGRQGGVSEGVYESLNCRNGSYDDPANILENRKRVGEYFGASDLLIHNAYQIHSPDVVVLEDAWDEKSERPEADALVSSKAGLALGILTADCTPVLFYGMTGNGEPVIAAAHAGWKGALGGVLNNTIQEMVVSGAQLKTIKACIGPCIAQKSYEVSIEFYNTFLDADSKNEKFFIPSDKINHFLFDLPGYCTKRLYDCGVHLVVDCGVDTYANEDGYFSYRRTTHAGENDYGGQISVIMIKRA